jgi:hypothetical protein
MEKIMWIALRAAILSVALSVPALVHATDTPRPMPVAPPARIPDPISASTEPSGATVPSASVPREVRRAVVADAAKRFKVAESAVVLGATEQVTWSDGSLGCPQRGQMYTQNLVAGYRIVAITNEGRMVYHTDSKGYVVVCGGRQDSTAPVPPPSRSPPDR